jgi:hypothetical protein
MKSFGHDPIILIMFHLFLLGESLCLPPTYVYVLLYQLLARTVIQLFANVLGLHKWLLRKAAELATMPGI